MILKVSERALIKMSRPHNRQRLIIDGKEVYAAITIKNILLISGDVEEERLKPLVKHL